MYSSELCQADFTEPPEVLDTVNMPVSIGKFVFSVLDAIMLFIPIIYKAVISLETVRINYGICVGFAFYNG